MTQIKKVGGKKLNSAKEKIDANNHYDLNIAVQLLKELSYTKFDETLDIAINLGVDPKHSDQMVRGIVKLPSGSGKKVRVAVICKDDKIEIAKEAGADLVGSMNIIEEIKAGKIDFDVCITTPDMMGVVGQIARILGPKGLMPNPKLGTVTNNIASAVKDAKEGQVEFRVEKAGIIHAGIGKLSFTVDKLIDNAKAILDAVHKARPAGVKGTYIKKIHLTSTMGPSLRLSTTGLGL
jgi:large subunit ribosomal protein L1